MTALTLVDKIRVLDAHLRSAGIDYILGGALALGYNVAEPRGTQDIDVQVYPRTIDELVAALPNGVEVTATALAHLRSDHQCRLYWGHTPLDIFLPVTDFHAELKLRALQVTFPGIDHPIAVLSGTDLTIFKALFDRPKDWVDIAEMVRHGSVDLALADRWLRSLGMDDRANRLADLGPH